jgi:hypothetical protein
MSQETAQTIAMLCYAVALLLAGISFWFQGAIQ